MIEGSQSIRVPYTSNVTHLMSLGSAIASGIMPSPSNWARSGPPYGLY